jgi:hypothetical protein
MVGRGTPRAFIGGLYQRSIETHELYVERDDFMENPSRDFFRLAGPTAHPAARTGNPSRSSRADRERLKGNASGTAWRKKETFWRRYA